MILGGWTYILASAPYGTLYVGVTNNIDFRVWQHREGEGSAFCRRYNVHRLVWLEHSEEIGYAIHREKRIKKWPRRWKIRLIEERNPNWDDLYERLAW
jgi:putative endonuclease